MGDDLEGDMWMSNLEELIEDENRVISYKFLSVHLSVHVNVAKQMLFAFTQKKKTEDLKILYLIAGEEENGNGIVRIVPEEDVNSVEKEFKTLTSKHVYSVGRKESQNSAVKTFNQDWTQLTETPHQNYNRFSAIKHHTPRLKEEAQDDNLKSSSNTQPPPKVSKESSVDSKDESSKKRKSSNETKPTVVKSKKGSGGGTISNMFAKAAEKSSSSSSKKKEENEENSPGRQNRINEEKEKKLEKVSVDLKKNKSKAKNKENASSKKRKRIQVMSDSDSSDNEKEEEEEENVEDSPPPPQAQLIESDEEDIIPATPKDENLASGRRRIKKMVNKTFVDDDGFIVTKKELQSCSEDEDDKMEVEETKPVVLKPEIKKEPVIKKPIQNANKNKQASIMNFFKKK